jgi:DNA (cytosine-5)-methyltransferase 1
MNELSLFSGCGGGLLGSHLLGWNQIGYVEIDDYCQRVIAQRIKDGILPNAPIFGDIRTFISEGYAASYTGLVDVLSGGFPCQPFSLAGKRAGADDARNMWPATAECVRLIRPRYCYFENVPGLISSGYFGRIVADLAACGYGVRWRVLSAAEVGAPHKRDRLWIVAYSDGRDEGRGQWPERESHQRDSDVAGNGAQRKMADANSRRRQQYVAQPQRAVPVIDARRWWSVESDVGRLVDGYAGRVAELKALGNGQVPAVAATAWRLLTEDLCLE